MDAQEIRRLQEAYEAVYENQQQLDEGYKKQDLMKQIDQSDRLKSKGLIDRLHKKVNRNTSHKKEYSERDARYNRERPEDQKRSKLVSDNNAKKKSFPNRLRRSDGQGIRDSYDYYDIILSHLLDEGYAETPEAAESIMVNMSEEWREDIMEISQKTASSAYDERKHREMTTPSNPKNVTKGGEDKSDVTFRRVRKKYGQRVAKKMRDQNPYNKYDY